MHCLPRHPVDESLNKLPTFDEVRGAIKAKKKNKACGLGTIPEEVYKYGRDLIQHQLHHLENLDKRSHRTRFQKLSNNYHL